MSTNRTAQTDDWEYGNSKIGYGVPWSVRLGGSTGPMHKPTEHFLKGHAVSFFCEECDTELRLATRAFQGVKRCTECGDLRTFRFDWERNRPEWYDRGDV